MTFSNKTPVIAFEGGDAAGKATQTALLNEWLAQAHRVKAATLSFPNYSLPSGQAIKNILMHPDGVGIHRRCVMYALDRQASMPTVVSAIKLGAKVVVFDRYIGSMMIYGKALLEEAHLKSKKQQYSAAGKPFDLEQEMLFVHNETYNRKQKLWEFISTLELDACGLPPVDLQICLVSSAKASWDNTNKRGEAIDTNESNTLLQVLVNRSLEQFTSQASFGVVKTNIAINCLDKQGNMRSAIDIHREIINHPLFSKFCHDSFN